jgi:putative transposase
LVLSTVHALRIDNETMGVFSRNLVHETLQLRTMGVISSVPKLRAVRWEAHRRYTNFINARGRWMGHLFQSRFASVAMDESHLISAVCYVSLNPVRARLVVRAEDWPWSSVRAHINGADDGLVTVRAVLDRIPHFAELLSTTQDQDFEDLRLAEGSGRPLGTAEFVAGLERLLGRPIARRAPGRKPTASVAGVQLKLLQ